MMPLTCAILGTPDLYGLGIRVSFYLLWFFVLLGERCHERHAQVPRALELVLAYAVFLGLITAAAGGYLFAVEVYISLLLISTTVYLLVPRHTTDMLGFFWQDIETHGRRSGSSAVAAARSVFVLAVVILHIWFWVAGVSSEDIDRSLRGKGAQEGCQTPQQVGFAFGPMDLRSSGFRVLNFLLMLILLIGGVIMGAMQTGLLLKKRRSGPWARRRRSRRARMKALKGIETFWGLVVATILIAAIELTIQWNGISETVNQAITATQMMPLGVVVALIMVFLYDLRNGSRRNGGSRGGSRGSSTRSSGSSRGVTYGYSWPSPYGGWVVGTSYISPDIPSFQTPPASIHSPPPHEPNPPLAADPPSSTHEPSPPSMEPRDTSLDSLNAQLAEPSATYIPPHQSSHEG
ncbi:hypothetical protein B0J18DRAFT_489840 [Chaetomium sp. MPI-SDFR-AT-0129]|nr:hypothetical protein B0J18DRAFT_489840 [Chaetomium sp. MPI-SDFR-AT-0129]